MLVTGSYVVRHLPLANCWNHKFSRSYPMLRTLLLETFDEGVEMVYM